MGDDPPLTGRGDVVSAHLRWRENAHYRIFTLNACERHCTALVRTLHADRCVRSHAELVERRWWLCLGCIFLNSCCVQAKLSHAHRVSERKVVRQDHGKLTMTVKDTEQEIRREDSLRAALLGLALRTFGDDFLELVDRTGPHKQALDASTWVTPNDEASGRERQLHDLIEAFQAELKQIGMRGLLIVASEEWLADEQRRIRARLYGSVGH